MMVARSRIVPFVMVPLLVLSVISGARAEVGDSSISSSTNLMPPAAPPGNSVVPKPMQQPPGAETRNYFQCNRDFVFQGKTHDCDSLVRQDGEGLRPYIQDTPQAIAELNEYQSVRRQARAIAYVGSAGLLAAIAGVIVSRVQGGSAPAACGLPNPPPGCPYLGPIIGYSGLGLLGASLIYGITLISSNESHLITSIQLHNDAHPSQPIELKFSTGFVF